MWRIHTKILEFHFLFFVSNVSGVWGHSSLRLVTSEFSLCQRDIGIPLMKNIKISEKISEKIGNYSVKSE